MSVWRVLQEPAALPTDHAARHGAPARTFRPRACRPDAKGPAGHALSRPLPRRGVSSRRAQGRCAPGATRRILWTLAMIMSYIDPPARGDYCCSASAVLFASGIACRCAPAQTPVIAPCATGLDESTGAAASTAIGRRSVWKTTASSARASGDPGLQALQRLGQVHADLPFSACSRRAPPASRRWCWSPLRAPWDWARGVPCDMCDYRAGHGRSCSPIS